MRLLSGMLCFALGLAGQEPAEASVPCQNREIVYFHSPEPAEDTPKPLFVLLHPEVSAGAEIAQRFWKQWQPIADALGWRLIVPWAGSTGPAWTDTGVKGLEAAVRDAQKRFPSDPARVYLAGQLDSASEVFYAISRAPELWTAALAIDGNPKVAIDTNRLYAANTFLVPLLWVVQKQDQKVLDPSRAKLAAVDFNVQVQTADQTTVKDALGFLAKRTSDTYPSKVDCETGSAAFGRCYWVEMTKFDLSLRNDVLRSTRVEPGSGAYLDLGGFGYEPAAPGPGARVGWLPENYEGPLKLDDRIISLGGKEIRDGQEYARMMEEAKDEKSVGIVIERGGKRQRLETRILIPRREETLTVRIQAEYLPQFKEIQVVSRGVAGIRVQLPDHWTPSRINWNGTDSGTADGPGCWAVDWGGKAARCGG